MKQRFLGRNRSVRVARQLTCLWPRKWYIGYLLNPALRIQDGHQSLISCSRSSADLLQDNTGGGTLSALAAVGWGPLPVGRFIADASLTMMCGHALSYSSNPLYRAMCWALGPASGTEDRCSGDGRDAWATPLTKRKPASINDLHIIKIVGFS